jgi:hypothetical protein
MSQGDQSPPVVSEQPETFGAGTGSTVEEQPGGNLRGGEEQHPVGGPGTEAEVSQN